MRWHVASDLAAPRLVRRAIVGMLAEAAWDPAAIDDVCIAASEVVTNALLHGGGIAFVDLDVGPDLIRLCVGDHVATPPCVRALGTAVSGRGMRIVEAIVDRWGVVPIDEDPAGKGVWIEASRRSGPPPDDLPP